MKKIKVLHIYRTFYPDSTGGVEEVIKQVSNAAVFHDIESRVFVLSPDPAPKKINYDGLIVFRERSLISIASCDIGGVSAFKTFMDLASWADILHFHFPWPFLDLLNICYLVKKPKIMTYHSDIVKQKRLFFFYKPLMRFTLSSMDYIVATSPSYLKTSPVLRRCVPSKKAKIIPLGMEDISSSAESSCSSGKIIKKLGLDGEKFILYLGVLRYYKGLHILLEACKNIRGKVVIAGGGPENNSLRSQAKKLELSNVIFAGHVSNEDKLDLLKKCTAFVLPSHLRSEAFGMVLIEASMFSKPMVTCEIGTGTSFVNEANVTGYVVEPENPDALANSLNSLLENDEISKEFGKNARVRYDSLFSGPVMGKSYAEIYRELSR